MDDMQVYIANLGKYNEGELVGAWFTFPIAFEEVKGNYPKNYNRSYLLCSLIFQALKN